MRVALLVGLCVLIAAGAYADDERSAVKAQMESMQQEMAAMQSTLANGREAIRASAGGAPESMKSANGKATVRIGGEVKIRYALGFESGYNENDGNDLTRYATGEWAVRTAKLTFDIDLTPDTAGHISLDLEKDTAGPGGVLNEVWYQWSNIGGSGLALKVGRQTLDFGMYNGDCNPWERVMVWDPAVKNVAQPGSYGRGNAGNLFASTDVTTLGATASYRWSEFKLSLGVFDGERGVTTDGSLRNFGLSNHYATLYYDPCWLEGLHLQAGYSGAFDVGQGSTDYGIWRDTTNADTATRRGSGYNASFDFGAYYRQERWAVYGETIFAVNQLYYRGATQVVFSVGADYNLTEKLRLGAAFDYGAMSSPNYAVQLDNGTRQLGMRASLGTNYDFGNGLYIRAQYSHYWAKTWGSDDYTSKCRDNDQIAFQTGFVF